MTNLLNEKLIWMTEDDFAKVIIACNIASSCLMQDTTEWRDLDGDLMSRESVQKWDEIVHEANLAIGRAKYVPEDTLTKLRLVLGAS